MPRSPRRAVDQEPPRDSVDRIVAGWAGQWPGLPVAPIEIVLRMHRLRARFDEELAAVFARFDLTPADFAVLASLRRSGEPFTVPQSTLMGWLALTSGTISVRLARLEKKGMVQRRPSTEDGRGVLVSLTARGRERFDQVAPDHLANEDVLLSALTDDERGQLAGLLRKLLVGFEHEHTESPLGLTVAPAHVARRARRTVGLTDRSGLLVEHVHPDTPAARAGLKPGDLLVALDGRPLRSTVDLAGAHLPLRLRVVAGEKERDVRLSADRAGQPKP